MFGFGRGKGQGFGKRRQHRHRYHSGCSLLDAQEEKRYLIVANYNKKTLEMGIYPGSIIEVIKAGDEDTNFIIKAHDAQIIIPPNVAEDIIIKC